jgi:hypothetical protein
MDASVLDAREHNSDTLVIGGSTEMVVPPDEKESSGDDEARNDSSELPTQVTEAQQGVSVISPVIVEQKASQKLVQGASADSAPLGKHGGQGERDQMLT